MRAGRILTLLCVLLPALSIGGPAAAAPPPAPTLLGPANGASVTVPFTISWSQVLDPAAQNGGYNWQVSSSSTFSTLAAADSTFPSVTQATVSGLANGTYFWRVDAVNGTVETGPWSVTRSFTVTGAGAGQLAAPTLNLPHGGTTQFHPMEAIRFSWSAVPGAATYTTEFSTDPSFPLNSANYYSVTNIPGTTDGTLHHESMPQGTWFMRVRAVDANRVQGATSNVISFSVLYGNPVGPPPGLTSPTGNPTLTLPVTFDWADGYNPQSSGYEFQVSTSSSFSTLVNPVPGLTESRIVYTDLPTGQLFWRVRSHQGMASPTTTAVTAWSATGTFTVSPAPPVPASVTLTRDPLYSGAEQRLIVQLTGPAPSGGAVVSLTSSDPNALPVPATVTIGAGFASGPELILFAGQVTTPRSVTVTGTYGGSSASKTITVMPPTLKSDPLQPEVRATGGAQMTGRVDLEGGGLAPAGGVQVSLSSDSPAATVPTTVTIPAGVNSTAFTIQTSAVSATTPITIRATHGGVTAQWQITLTPSPAPDSLTLRPVSTTNGSQGVVTIPASASAGHNQLVRVTSSNPGLAAVPQFVTVFAGSGVGYFDIATTPVSAPTSVTISVSGGGVTLSSVLTVHPSLPSLTGLTVNPTSVVGGNSATGTVTLSSAAPTGGVAVSLSSNLPGSASVPATVTVPSGATSASFTVTTFPVDNTTAQLSASLDGVFQFAALTVTRAPATPTLSALTVSPSSVVGGASSTGTVTLSAAAPSGGAIVSLSDNSAAATVPASVTVAAGATSRTFTVTTNSVTSPTPVTISGSSGGATRSTTLTVNPPTQTPQAPPLLSPADGATVAQPVTLDWTDVGAATSYRIQIDDSSDFSAPRVVDRTVTVSQFTAGSLPVRQHWWRVRGINSAGTAGAWSTVRRFTPQAAGAAPTLSGITLSPTSVVGGTSSQGTATLTSAAPPGGAVVMLTSSNTASATVPASVTVAAGASSGTFTVSTMSVTASTTATISGTYGGVTRSATLTVSPPGAQAALSAVSVNPTSVAGGTSSQGTLTLTSVAPAGGFAVALSSSSTAATVPTSVTVAQGATSATFAIATGAVATSTPVTITASAAGVTRTAALTVTPPGQGGTLTVTATGRSGERVTSNPAGINVTVGSTGSASFATGTLITLSATNGRDVVWSGACSSGGNKTKTCTFTINGNATVTANLQ